MADDFTTCKGKDDPDYDYYACQFFDSMTKYQTTDPKGYWFGRLLAFGFKVENLFGGSFSEDTLREDLENSDIILHGYSLLNVIYTPGGDTKPETATASGSVELDITVNGRRQTVTSDFTHSIKRCWCSTEAAFS